MLFVLAWLLWLHHRQNVNEHEEEENKVEEEKKVEEDYKDEEDGVFVFKELVVDGVNVEEEEEEEEDVLNSSSKRLLDDYLAQVVEAAVSETTSECLFIDEDHQHRASCQGTKNGFDQSSGVQDKRIVDENVIPFSTVAEDETELPMFDDFSTSVNSDDLLDIDLQNEQMQVRHAKLFSQPSFKKNKGENFNVSNSSDDFLETDLEDGNTHIRQAKLFSQPSFKKGKGDNTKSNLSSGSPFKSVSPRTNVDSYAENNTDTNLALSDVNNITSTQKQYVNKDNSNVSQHTSILSVITSGKDGPSSHMTYLEESLVRKTSATSEDDEIEAAFKSEELSIHLDDDMKYTTAHGTSVAVTTEKRAGRIHSIVLKGDNAEHKTNKIKVSSPRVRARSPRIRTSNVSPSIVSIHQNGNHNDNHSDMAHLVVNTHRLEVQTDSKQLHSPVSVTAPQTLSPNTKSPPSISPKGKPQVQRELTEEQIAPVVSESIVESNNPDFMLDEQPPVEQSKSKDVGKLSKRNSQEEKAPRQIEQPVAETTDFDAIMKRRKKYVDTIDDAGRLLGQIAHRDDKITGAKRNLSKHWARVKDAVRRKHYLSFKDKPMRKISQDKSPKSPR